MENFKNNFDDLKYLASEMQDTLIRNKRDIPEDFYKVYSDLLYHSNIILKEMEKIYEQFIEAWYDSNS